MLLMNLTYLLKHVHLNFEFLQEDNFSNKKNNFPIEYLKFPTEIKELPTGFSIPIGFELNSQDFKIR